MLALVLSCVAVVDQIEAGFISAPLTVCGGVNILGEWETVVTAFIFNIPQMEKKVTNIIGTCSPAAHANSTKVGRSCKCVVARLT